jgi:hypothetical protein
VSNTRESLCDLIETRSAQHCIGRRKLWEWTLTAIRDRVLIWEFPDDVEPDPQMAHVEMVRTACIGALPAIKSGSDPSKWWWCRRLMISPAAFDKWLKEVLRNNKFPPRAKRSAGAKPTPREKIKEFVDGKYPKGLPPGVTYKDVAKAAEGTVGRIVDVRTVSRALGGK